NDSDKEALMGMFGLQLQDEIATAQRQKDENQLRTIIRGGLAEVFGREIPALENHLVKSLLEGKTIAQSLNSFGTTDKASTATETEKVGGIDLNPALLNLQIKRDGNGIPLPIEMQPIRDMKIDGFVPLIINITPIMSVPMLLGIAEHPDQPINQA